MQPYTKIDRKLHQWSQLLAKVNRTYREEKSDDSHTNICYDPIRKALRSRWVEADGEEVCLLLELESLRFSWLTKTNQTKNTHGIEGASIGDLEAKLAEDLKNMGFDTSGFKDAMHYEIPDYEASPDLSSNDAEAIATWMQYRALANYTCDTLLNTLQVGGETRIWPHHFDTGIYVKANENMGIGGGLAMEDDMAGAPYFYTAGYPESESLDYVNAPALTAGEWMVTENWKGAILRLSALENKGAQEQLDIVHRFWLESAGWMLGQK